jgi:E1A-binding protein p400
LQQTIKDLFEEPSGLDSLLDKKEDAAQAVATPVPEKETGRRSRVSKEKAKAAAQAEADWSRLTESTEEKLPLTEDQIEQALCAAEDESDIQAAQVAKAEQKAELAAFDENIPWDEREAELRKEREDEISKVELELNMLEKEVGHDCLMVLYFSWSVVSSAHPG